MSSGEAKERGSRLGGGEGGLLEIHCPLGGYTSTLDFHLVAIILAEVGGVELGVPSSLG